jgi:hypothetical protein
MHHFFMKQSLKLMSKINFYFIDFIKFYLTMNALQTDHLQNTVMFCENDVTGKEFSSSRCVSLNEDAL